MTVFKYFFKILNKNKMIIILYTAILVVFGGLNMKTSDNSVNFEATKPNVLIVNNDTENRVTKNLVEYIEKNSTMKNIKNDNDSISDALFYRDINYIIYIPENYGIEFINGKSPAIEVKSTGDYQASYSEMLLNKYLKVASSYQKNIKDDEVLINKINDTLSKETEIQITSKMDTNKLSKATLYYNFVNYSVLAGCVYIICLMLSSFRDEKIKRRTIVSAMNYKKYNRTLLLSNSVFAVVLWLIYVLLSFVLVGNIMFSASGILYIINSFIFTICAVALAFLIGNLVNNKNAINGIVNVVALGSSFLCGAFVPLEWLPDSVLKIAHILPSYWYIQNNEFIKNLENFDFAVLKPYIINSAVLIIFMLLFVIISNLISRRARKEN